MFPVYDNEERIGGNRNPLDYGCTFDFTQTFTDQFKVLQQVVPRFALIQQGEDENSKYTNAASNNKNCYLIHSSNHNEDCQYATSINFSKKSFNCHNVLRIEKCYECIDVVDSYQCFYCQECIDCSRGLYNKYCTSCRDCIGCYNLTNAQYCIDNKQYTKEEYMIAVKKYRDAPSTYKNVFSYSKIILSAISGHQNEQTLGNNIFSSKSVLFSYDCVSCENLRYSNNLATTKDSMDVSYW